MMMKLILIGCIFLVSHTRSQYILYEEQYDDLNLIVSKYFATDNMEYSNNVGVVQDTVEDEGKVSLSDIKMFTSAQMNEEDVHIDLELLSLQFNTTLDTVYFRANFTSIMASGQNNSGIIVMILHNISMSGVTGISNEDTLYSVTNLYANYDVTNIHSYTITLESIISKISEGKPVQIFVRCIKEYLDFILKSKLNDLLEKKSIYFHSTVSNLNMFSTPANAFVDILLIAAKKVLTDNIPLPNVNLSFKKGYFNGWNGWFEKLSTLHRTTDVTITQDQESVKLFFELALGQVNFGFKNYKAKYSIFKVKGKAYGSVGRNAITIFITVTESKDNCSVTLNKLEVTKLDNLSIKLTGLGAFNKILSKKATKIINNSKGTIINEAQSELTEKINNFLKTFDCKQIPTPV